MPPIQVTPEVAAAQLVADASQGEAEQAMILEVVPLMSMEVEGLMMVIDPALELIQRSSPWREKKEEKKAQRKKKKKRNNKKTTTTKTLE